MIISPRLKQFLGKKPTTHHAHDKPLKKRRFMRPLMMLVVVAGLAGAGYGLTNKGAYGYDSAKWPKAEAAIDQIETTSPTDLKSLDADTKYGLLRALESLDNPFYKGVDIDSEKLTAAQRKMMQNIDFDPAYVTNEKAKMGKFLKWLQTDELLIEAWDKWTRWDTPKRIEILQKIADHYAADMGFTPTPITTYNEKGWWGELVPGVPEFRVKGATYQSADYPINTRINGYKRLSMSASFMGYNEIALNTHKDAKFGWLPSMINSTIYSATLAHQTQLIRRLEAGKLEANSPEFRQARLYRYTQNHSDDIESDYKTYHRQPTNAQAMAYGFLAEYDGFHSGRLGRSIKEMEKKHGKPLAPKP